MPMVRCRACDAPNVDDRVTCWRCLRDLDAEPAARVAELVERITEPEAQVSGPEAHEAEPGARVWAEAASLAGAASLGAGSSAARRDVSGPAWAA